jgi:DNA invertase Pin-like site-specific DNA recombinase
MLERQREGIANVKAEGKYNGRAPTLVQSPIRSEIAKKVGVGVASVYRVLRAAAGAAQMPR